MCGRYTWSYKHKLPHVEDFKLPTPLKSVSFNRAPGQSHPIITEKKGKPAWSYADWGLNLVIKQSRVKIKPINARIESILEKNIFKKPFENSRCLIPADGYYEWQNLEYEKYPYYHFKSDMSSFLMAGIYTVTENSKSFAIMTHSAAKNLSHIHNRMPVIIKPQDWNTWINPNSNLGHILKDYSDSQIELNYHQVHARVNRTSENDEGLIFPFKEKQSTLW